MSFLLVFVPVLGAALAHGPVLRYDLARGLARPLDGGLTLGGRRLLGDNKTWRGALAMAGGVLAAALLLRLWPWYWSRLPGDIRDAGPALFGTLLGLGTVAGELPNSFLKRRLRVAPGTQRRGAFGVLLSVFDQGDFVLGIWVALLPIWTMSPAQAAIAFAVVAAVHSLVNLIGYAIGARTAPV